MATVVGSDLPRIKVIAAEGGGPPFTIDGQVRVDAPDVQAALAAILARTNSA